MLTFHSTPLLDSNVLFDIKTLHIFRNEYFCCIVDRSHTCFSKYPFKLTSSTLGISVQNIKIVFSDPERDRRQSTSPPAEGSHARNAAQKDNL